MEKKKLTEKELIELTMDYGYSGSELNNPHFLEKGYLKQNGAYKSFTKKVTSICESWNRLKKKKGQPVMYEIINLKKEPTPIPNNRIKNGKKPTREDFLMRDYIQFCLGLDKFNDGKAHSLNFWAEAFGLTSKADLNELDDTDVFRDLYWKSEVAKVLNTFKSTILARNRAVVLNSFKQLERQNKIKVNDVPLFIHIDKTVSSPSQKEYDDVDFEIDKILASKNLSRNDYYYNHLKGNVVKARAEVKTMLQDKGLSHLFVGYRIELIESFVERQIGVKEFLNAYCDRLVQLTLQRENNPKYQVSYVEKRFYIFNTLVLLRELGYQIDEALIKQFEPIEQDLEVMHNAKREYMMGKEEHYKLQYDFSNRVKDEERQAWGFRTIYL